MKLIYIGEHFYHESATMMSSIYGEDGTRSDWGKVQVALQAGQSIEIRQATQQERDFYEAHLSRLKREREIEKAVDAALPAFKQYRDADGKFYFKLVQGERVLLQSVGFNSPRDAGQRIAAIRQGEFGDGASDFALGEGVADDEVNAALAAFVAAQLEGAKGKP